MAGPFEGPVSGLGTLADRLGGEVPKLARPLQYRYGPGSGSFVAPKSGYLHLYAIGGGGSGRLNSGQNAQGGGGSGAAAGYSMIAVREGQQVSFTVGAGGLGRSGSAQVGDGRPGEATTITLPDGKVCVAGGGLGGGQTNAAQPGGVATGFDVNSTGGLGGNGFVSPYNGGNGDNSGGMGETGNSASGGGGGGSGGFGSDNLFPAPGIGGRSGSPTVGPGPGGGTGASYVNQSQVANGGPGLLVLIFEAFQ